MCNLSLFGDGSVRTLRFLLLLLFFFVNLRLGCFVYVNFGSDFSYHVCVIAISYVFFCLESMIVFFFFFNLCVTHL